MQLVYYIVYTHNNIPSFYKYFILPTYFLADTINIYLDACIIKNIENQIYLEPIIGLIICTMQIFFIYKIR